MNWVNDRKGRQCVLVLLSIMLQGSNAASAEDLDGIVEPHQVVALSPQVGGILDTVPLRRGDLVDQGDIVATLKSGMERVAVDRAKIQLEFARRQSERNDELFRKDMLSAFEQDELVTQVRLGELQLQEAEERLRMKTIRSPVKGVVVERLLAPGEYAGEGPILTVAQIDPLNVEVIVPVSLFDSIREGSMAEVRPEAPVGGVHQARVVIVDQVIDAASGTFGVRLELPNPDYDLPAGLKCRVRFQAE